MALSPIFGIILTLLLAGPVRAQRHAILVEEVDVVGQRRLTKGYILSHVKTKAGEPYSEALIMSDLLAIVRLGWFDGRESRVIQEVGKRAGGVVIVFEVVELPLISDVSFEGLGDVEESEIIEAFRRERVKVAKDYVYEPVEIGKAMRTIKKVLAPQGWPDISVTVRHELGSASFTSITFVVERQARF